MGKVEDKVEAILKELNHPFYAIDIDQENDEIITGLKTSLLEILRDDDEDDRKYTEGSRMAWRTLLSLACRELGYENAREVSWIAEREAAISALRDICGLHGDNDWDEKLYLADVIEKHLGNHLGY
jgi:hypothetical protein